MAPVICRPNEIVHGNGNEWKAKVLQELYPRVLGIIDDNAKLLQFLNLDYKGKVFMYEHQDNLGFPYAVACKDWLTVYEEVKKYSINMIIEKPKKEDLGTIREILEQWTEPEEVEKYLFRINSEIAGQTEYAMNFWVIKDKEFVSGIAGLAKPLSIILPLAKSSNPGEIKILYINNKHQGKGLGRKMISFLENEAKNQKYQELFIRSALRYQETAYGFYEKMGYVKLGKLDNDMSVFYKALK